MKIEKKVILKFIQQCRAGRNNNDHLTPSPSLKRRGERRIGSD